MRWTDTRFIAAPALAQERDRPPSLSREVQILSGAAIDQMLDQKTVPSPTTDFSTNDATAIQQINQRAKQIDRDVINGICTGC
jgi:hypothetical protein